MENIISLSSAGGGKTTRLISRIKEIIPGKMLVVSFTNASCKDIINRLNDKKINVITLHGFAYSLLMENYHIIDSSVVFVEMFLWRYFQIRSLGVQTIASLVENYFIFQDFAKDISFLSKEDQELNLEFRNLIQDISMEKAKHSLVFFSDLINIINNNFHAFKEEISDNYDHLLVDEAQDLSQVQLDLLFKIITEVFILPGKSFFIVGDKKQSIYSFQGSSEKFYDEFLNKLNLFCKERNISLNFENQNQTYRFGGEILKKVNSVFAGHTSNINHGNVIEKSMTEQEITDFLMNYMSLYSGPLEDIMVLYERNTNLIINLQEKLQEFGMQCKIYLQNNKLIEALHDICFFEQTEAEYYMARILQGPFVFCTEPEFYERAMKREWDHKELFSFLKEKKSAYEVLTYLSKNIYLNPMDSLIFIELLKQSKNYLSLGEMLCHLRDTISLKKEGVKFSTIHGAKGLEAKIVFYIKQKPPRPKIQVNLNPFFFSTEKKESLKEEKNNVEYVALSRAKQELYIINCLE